MATTPRKTTSRAKAAPAHEPAETLVHENPIAEAAAFDAGPAEAPVVERVAPVEPAPAPLEASAGDVKTEVPTAGAGAAKPRAAKEHAVKSQAAETAHALEGSFNAASKSLQAFSAKAMEAYQANAAASMDYMKALSGVRSVSEAIALQSEHMRKQYESLSAQAKELTSLAQQVAADAAGPLKEQFGKGFKSST